MRVVLDSSVLVAAHISRAGVCAELLEDVLMDHEWVISRFIADEFARKLREKFDFPRDELEDVRNMIMADAEMVVPAEIPATACRDPDDLPVLGTAVAGQVDLLITVDKDLLDIRQYSTVQIVRPGEFWRRVDTGRE